MEGTWRTLLFLSRVQLQALGPHAELTPLTSLYHPHQALAHLPYLLFLRQLLELFPLEELCYSHDGFLGGLGDKSCEVTPGPVEGAQATMAGTPEGCQPLLRHRYLGHAGGLVAHVKNKVDQGLPGVSPHGFLVPPCCFAQQLSEEGDGALPQTLFILVREEEW